MTTNYKVAVYGAGYTGKLVSEYLAQRNIPFALVGRNASKIDASIKKVGERLGRDYEVEAIVSENTVESLTQVFANVDVVLNTVGPFMQLADPVVRACLESNCHYLDTTGEQDWVILAQEKYARKFEEKNLLLSPANSFMWVSGALAAEVALETEGVDTLDIVYDIINALPSVGSSRSFLRMVTEPQFYLEHGEYKEWVNDKAFTVYVPHKSQSMLALPWSGACEPVWFKSDPRVRTCKVLTAFGDEMIEKVVGLIKDVRAKSAGKSSDEKESLTNQIGDEIASGEPKKDDMDIQRSYIVCRGQGRQVTNQVTISLAAPYQFTGQICAEAAERILAGKLKKAGFQSSAKAFGHRELLAKFKELGYTNNP